MVEDVRILRRELEEYEALKKVLGEGDGWRSSALEKKIQRLADQVAERLWEIAKLLEEIQDPELRLIFELRHFRGYTWSEVAKRLPTMLSADGARMKHDRYWKKVKKSAHRTDFQ